MTKRIRFLSIFVFLTFVGNRPSEAASLTDAEKTAFADWFGRVECENFYEPYRDGQPLALPWYIYLFDFDLDGNGTPEIVMYEGGMAGTGGVVWDAYQKKTTGWEPIMDMAPYYDMARWECYMYALESKDGRCFVSSHAPIWHGLDDERITNELARVGASLEASCGNNDMLLEVQDVRHWMDADGLLHSDRATNGATRMLLDPQFLCLDQLRVERFLGTNYVHTPISPPAWPDLSPYRRCCETNAVTPATRAALAALCETNGQSSASALAAFLDLGADGRLDAIVADPATEDAEGLLEWRLYPNGPDGWIAATNALPSGRVDYPAIPPSFRAGTNELFRIWTGVGTCYLNVFRCANGSTWGVVSPLTAAQTPPEALQRLQVGALRPLYGAWIEWFQSECGGAQPPRDFYQLFELGSGMIQLERLIPEPLLP